MVLAGVCGLAALTLLTAGRPKGVRLIAALGVSAVVWGWGVAQYPVLLPGTAVTLSNAGAPQSTMVALIVVFILAALLIGPSFVLLFSLQGRRLLHADEAGTLAPGSLAGRIRPPYAPPGRQPPAGRSPVIRAAVLAVVVLGALVRRRRPR